MQIILPSLFGERPKPFGAFYLPLYNSAIMSLYHVLIDKSPVYSTRDFCAAWVEYGILESLFRDEEHRIDFVSIEGSKAYIRKH